MSNTHRFALFYSDLSTEHTTIAIDDAALVQRIGTILRLAPSDEIILFNAQEHATCTITAISRKGVELRIDNHQRNSILTPAVTILLPLLKKAAFEQALYIATEMGANEIQLVQTHKSIHQWQSHDQERAQRIIIAAAEQAKQFALPLLHTPQPLAAAVAQCSKPVLVADIAGNPLKQWLLNAPSYNAITIMIGPEGDFTATERPLLERDDFYRVKLTPTILRSEHALALLLGIVRSMS